MGRVGAGVVMLMGGVERIGASEAGREKGVAVRVDPGRGSNCLEQVCSNSWCALANPDGRSNSKSCIRTGGITAYMPSPDAGWGWGRVGGEGGGGAAEGALGTDA